MQRGVETLDTYLKLLLQVLELRYIASPPVCNQKAVVFTSDACISQEEQRKLFYICSVKMGLIAKRLTRVIL